MVASLEGAAATKREQVTVDNHVVRAGHSLCAARSARRSAGQSAAGSRPTQRYILIKSPSWSPRAAEWRHRGPGNVHSAVCPLLGRSLGGKVQEGLKSWEELPIDSPPFGCVLADGSYDDRAAKKCASSRLIRNGRPSRIYNPTRVASFPSVLRGATHASSNAIGGT